MRWVLLVNGKSKGEFLGYLLMGFWLLKPRSPMARWIHLRLPSLLFRFFIGWARSSSEVHYQRVDLSLLLLLVLQGKSPIYRYARGAKFLSKSAATWQDDEDWLLLLGTDFFCYSCWSYWSWADIMSTSVFGVVEILAKSWRTNLLRGLDAWRFSFRVSCCYYGR